MSELAGVIPIRPSERVEYSSDPTKAQYEALRRTCSHLAEHLFDERMPKPLLVFNGGLKGASHFGSAHWWSREDGRKHVSEIALNPNLLRDLTPCEIAATLVHELTHLWQETHGTPPRPCYHDKEWSLKMRSIGLMPFDPSKEDKHVGQTIRQSIIAGGRFEAVFAAMPADWFLPFLPTRPEEKKKYTTKSKFVCGGCGDIALGKPSLLIACLKPTCNKRPFDLEKSEEGN